MPLLFVGDIANNPVNNRFGAVIAAYDLPGAAGRRVAALDGVTVCFAPPLPDGGDPKGDPRLPTSSITFRAGGVNSKARPRPNFYPEIETAEVGIRALQRLLGRLNAVVRSSRPR